MQYTTPWPTLIQMLLSLFHIPLKFFRSIKMKAIWSLTSFLMIRCVIPTAIHFFLTFFAYGAEFSRGDRRTVKTRSHTSFPIGIDLVILDHIGQLTNPLSFSRLAWSLYSLIFRPWCIFLQTSAVSDMGKIL